MTKQRRVSIPFIAGQWSLPVRRGERGLGVACFNPLHCGAVVASAKDRERAQERAKFQSPSLRGSGRFWDAARGVPMTGSIRFNPLHCGAVVASRSPHGGARPRRRFQSPSLRGSGRFKEKPYD